MKTLLISLITIICIQFSFSQHLRNEIGFNDGYYEFAEDVIAFDGASFLLKFRWKKGISWFSSSMTKVDTLGIVIWDKELETEIEGEDYVSIVDVDFTPIVKNMDSLFTLSYVLNTGGCDVGGCDIWVIQSYNKDGDLISQTDFKNFKNTGCYDIKLSGTTWVNDSTIMTNLSTSDTSFVMTIDPKENLVDSLTVEIKGLESFTTLGAFEFISYKENTLYAFNQLGEVEETYTFSENINHIEVHEGSLYTLTADSLFVFDETLTITNETKVENYSNYSEFHLSEDKLFFLGEKDELINVLTLNHDLLIQDIYEIPEKKSSIDFFGLNPNHLMLVQNFSLARFGTVRYLDYSLKSGENTQVNRTDIGIADLEVIHVNAYGDEGGEHVRIKAAVELKNYGDKHLNDCKINAYRGPMTACGSWMFFEHFSDLDLAPGESKWIELNADYVYDWWVGYFDYGDSINVEVCVYTSHPNNVTDLNPENDKHCKIVYAGNLGLNENQLQSLTVYPNPTSGSFTIEMSQFNSVESINISVYDQLGREVYKKQNTNSVEQLDLSGKGKGVYFIKIQVGNELLNKKMVVK